jgi:hypothetical protein
MASIICRNGQQHTHSSVQESKSCWGAAGPLTAPVAVPVPVATPAPVAYVRPTSDAQLRYVRDLNGDTTYAQSIGYDQCHLYLNALLGKAPTAATPARRPPVEDTPEVKMVKGLLPFVPEAYYCVDTPNHGTIFLRVSHPKKNRLAGAIKVQSQHSDQLHDFSVLWPSGQMTHRTYPDKAIETLLALVADHQSACLRYAEKINKCCCCNKPLTDERSRYYGIGPDCEQKGYMAWVIDRVEEHKGVYVPGAS